MKNYTRNSFKLIGKSVLIQGQKIHEQHYSEQKTAFYAELFKEGLLKNLMPYSLDKKGYALIVPHKDGIQYYAGVISEKEVDGYETIEVQEQKYLVTSANGNKSRQLFDELEDSYFEENVHESTKYNGGIVLEVLLNGSPADAEVELWIPIK